MKNYFWSLFSLLWGGAIFYLSFYTPVSKDSVSYFMHQDKLGHFVFYAVLCLSLIKTFSQEIVLKYSLKTGTALAFIYGALIELGQYFLTIDRDGNFMDALANGLGVFLVALLINNYPKLFWFNPKT